MNHFIDVGANVGQTFDEYLSRDPAYDGWTVWCLEPSPRHWPGLCATAERYRERYNIHLCNFGLHAATGSGVFYQKDDPRGDSFYAHLESDHLTANLAAGHTMHIATTGIVDFLQHYIPAGDAATLKLDCEGSEYAILTALACAPTAVLERVRRILVEWHTIRTPENLLHPAELVARFADLGCPLESWVL